MPIPRVRAVVAYTEGVEELRRIAANARWRIRMDRAVGDSGVVVVTGAAVFMVMAVSDRLGIESWIPWFIAGSTLAAAVAAGIIAVWHRSAVDELQAAAEVDRRFDLRERLSSAIACEHRTDAFAAALHRDASTATAAIAGTLSSKFPVRIPQSIGIGVVLIGLSAIVLGTGQWGWFGGNGEGGIVPSVIPIRERVDASVDEVLAEMKDRDELSEELQEELQGLQDAVDLAGDDPEDMRREALRSMTDLQRKLDDMLNDERAGSLQELERRLRSLTLENRDEVRDLAEALKRGDFTAAKQALEQLQERMNRADLDDATKQALSDQLKDLAKELERLAEANEALAEALEQSGLDEALAGDPDAAKAAVENAKHLNAEQKKRLLDLIEAQEQAAQACKNMGKGCKEAAGGKSGAMEGELSDLEALKMFMEDAKAVKKACKSAVAGMCSGSSDGGGPGHGGQGTGEGRRASFEQTDTATETQRSPVTTLEGTIIARQLFDAGVVAVGESQSEARDAILSERRDTEEAIAEEEVPRRYHELLRHYFGRLESLARRSPNDADDDSE